MSDIVRVPTQQRSIQTKQKIIEAGYKLISQKGFFNTNTTEIAKEAEVSTGIVYGYFHNKKDILYEVLDIYIKNAFDPILDMISSYDKKTSIEVLTNNVLDLTIKIHEDNKGIHEALHSLSSTDSHVESKFMEAEDTLTKDLVTAFTKMGYDNHDLTERVHLAMELVQSYAHERVLDNHEYINYDKMYKLISCIIVDLFKI
ncbi:MAG: TetR/AcrR family transcriptional regulator [Clostridia bacterium]|nr:TetR/AcrR family transcriptional regulator [Clostridia bacterium]